MSQITQAISFARDNFFYLFVLCIPVLLLEAVLLITVEPLMGITQIEDIEEFMKLNGATIFYLLLVIIIATATLEGALVSGYESINLSVKRSAIDLYSVGLRKFLVLLVAYVLFVIVLTFSFLMLILPGIYVMGRFSLFPSLIMFENEGILKSLGRSWEMTDEYSGKLFGITLFFMAVTWVTTSIASALIPDSTIQIFILLIIEYAIIIAWKYVYYSLYKSLSN